MQVSPSDTGMTVQEEAGAVAAPAPVKRSPSRRPDIDVIRVGLTWGILFFHICVAYAPAMRW